MTHPDDAWTPKVHPLTRHVEPEDPMELVMTPAAGDPDVMLECILQEFLWMGWDADQLLALFHHPGYPLLCQLREYYGAAEVQRRVEALVARCGRLRFREVLAEPDEGEDHDHEVEPALYQIALPPTEYRIVTHTQNHAQW